MKTEPQDRVAQVAASLTAAQRRAICDASFSAAKGVWHPAGWYSVADKRVRRILCRHRIILDYLCPRNRLTPLGLAIRNHLSTLKGVDQP